LEGYLHVEAGKIVDGRGQPLTLRGVGLGNWLLPEGYMWKFGSPGPQSPREIEAFIQDLIGPEHAFEFWRRFRDTFITQADIERISAEGFNHVRLPINSRVVIEDDGELIEAGFALIDRLIEWCRRHQLWVVLDLHGAPGGQTGTKIDDSSNGAPELFTDDRYRALTVKLWRAMARRYRDETAVAAYDLLNEPLPNEHQHTHADRLRDLYLELTSAIRKIDRNHVITYEGTHWSTNWEIFTDVWDPNSILQFHKYWSQPDRPSIQTYLDVGRDLGLPIYMGEGGENYADWIQMAFQLYEDHGISWNFWPWKKVETLTSPCSVNAPPGWTAIVDYAARTGARPPSTTAWHTLEALVKATSFSRCTYRSEVISSLFKRPPLKIPAAGFGFRGAGESYSTSSAVPMPAFRNDDLVTIRHADGPDRTELDWNHNGGVVRGIADELLVSLGPGDWVAYDIEVRSPSRYRIVAAVHGGGTAMVSVDGAPVEGTTVRLTPGHHVVRVTGLAQETLVRSVEISPEDGRRS